MKNQEKKEEYLHCKIQAKLKIALINKARKENKSIGEVTREAIRKHLKKGDK